MSSLDPNEKVVATGTYLYAGTFECDFRIAPSPIRYGSGDYQDDPDVADYLIEDTCYVQYGSTTQRGVFNGGGGGYPTLSEDRSVAETAPNIVPTVRWRTGAA